MKMFGVYDFTASVGNRLDPELHVNLIVRLFQHLAYYTYTDEQGSRLVTEMNSLNGKYYEMIIPAGYNIAFPLHYGDETVEIYLLNSSIIPYSYSISAGATGLCAAYKFPPGSIPDATTTLSPLYDEADPKGVQFTESSLEDADIFKKELYKQGEDFHVGGIWTIPANFPYGLMVQIRKHNFDPETVPVEIGPQPPGKMDQRTYV